MWLKARIASLEPCPRCCHATEPIADASGDGADAIEDEEEDAEEEEEVEEVVRRMTVSQAGVPQVFQPPAEVIKEGQMTKKGDNRKNWKKRWFVLYAESIAYLDKKGGNVKGGILFEDATLVRDATGPEVGKKEHCFVVELPHRHYVVNALSLEERDAWKAAIAKILLGLGKDPAAESQRAVPKPK